MNEGIFDRFTCQSLIYLLLLLLLYIFRYIMMFSMTGRVVCYLHLKILPASNLQQTIPVNCKKYFSNEIQYLIIWLAVLILSICDHVKLKTFNPFIFFFVSVCKNRTLCESVIKTVPFEPDMVSSERFYCVVLKVYALLLEISNGFSRFTWICMAVTVMLWL